MANKTVVGEIKNIVSFEVDARSKSNLKKFEKKLDRLKQKMQALKGAMPVGLGGGGRVGRGGSSGYARGSSSGSYSSRAEWREATKFQRKKDRLSAQERRREDIRKQKEAIMSRAAKKKSQRAKDQAAVDKKVTPKNDAHVYKYKKEQARKEAAYEKRKEDVLKRREQTHNKIRRLKAKREADYDKRRADVLKRRDQIQKKIRAKKEKEEAAYQKRRESVLKRRAAIQKRIRSKKEREEAAYQRRRKSVLSRRRALHRRLRRASQSEADTTLTGRRQVRDNLRASRRGEQSTLASFSGARQHDKDNLRAQLKSLRNEYRTTSMTSQQFKHQQRMLTQEFSRQARSVRDLNQRFLSLRHAMVGMGIAASSLAAGGYITNIGQQFDKVDVLLHAATGSAAGAAKEFQFLKDTTNKWGVTTLEAAKGYTQLRAATRGTKITLEDTRNLFEATTKASAAFGMSADDTYGAMRAFVQMVSKGNVQMEELRLQLGDRMPRVLQLAAESMGMAGEDGIGQFVKAVENGQIKAEAFVGKFAKSLSEFTNEAALIGSKKNLAAMNRMINAWREFVNVVFRGGFDKFTQNLYSTVTSILNILTPFANYLMTTFATAFDIATAPLRALLTVLESVVQFFGGDATKIGEWLGNLTGILIGINLIAAQLLLMNGVARVLTTTFAGLFGGAAAGGLLTKLKKIAAPLFALASVTPAGRAASVGIGLAAAGYASYQSSSPSSTTQKVDVEIHHNTAASERFVDARIYKNNQDIADALNSNN